MEINKKNDINRIEKKRKHILRFFSFFRETKDARFHTILVLNVLQSCESH